MMSAPSPSTGSRAASHSRRARYDSAVYQCRPMRLSTRFEPDCSGACRCAARFRGASIRSRAIVSSTSVASMEESRKRSEEHTSELQSPYDLVCRLLLEKKKKKKSKHQSTHKM